LIGRIAAMKTSDSDVSYEYVASYLWREVFARHHVVKLVTTGIWSVARS
jgi:hypothetical protein